MLLRRRFEGRGRLVERRRAAQVDGVRRRRVERQVESGGRLRPKALHRVLALRRHLLHHALKYILPPLIVLLLNQSRLKATNVQWWIHCSPGWRLDWPVVPDKSRFVGAESAVSRTMTVAAPSEVLAQKLCKTRSQGVVQGTQQE